MLYVLLVLLLVNLVLTVKILVLVNKIKLYQYTNNLKLLGFIKKEVGQMFILNKKWSNVRIHKGDNNDSRDKI